MLERVRRSWVALMLAFSPLADANAQATRDAAADGLSAPRPRGLCWRPNIDLMCRRWLVVDAGIYKELSRSVRSLSARDARSAFGPHGTWELGAMRNVDPDDAVGAAAIVGFGGGGFIRHGARARYRRWLRHGDATDVAAGPVWLDARGIYAYPPILSTDVRYSQRNVMALTVRLDVADQPRFARGTSVYGGVTFVSKSAMVATLVAAVGTLIGSMVAAAGMN